MTRTIGMQAVRLAALQGGQPVFLQALQSHHRAWRARASTKNALNALDDRMLRDIGVRRIEAVTREVGQFKLAAAAAGLGTLHRMSRHGRLR